MKEEERIERPVAVAQKGRLHKTGIPELKNKVRTKDADFYRQFKNMIAPASQLHHEWLNNGTAEYSGLALVDPDQHMRGIIDVIYTLRGEITFFTEASLQGREEAIQW
jgi:hypothetical protein